VESCSCRYVRGRHSRLVCLFVYGLNLRLGTAAPLLSKNVPRYTRAKFCASPTEASKHRRDVMVANLFLKIETLSKKSTSNGRNYITGNFECIWF